MGGDWFLAVISIGCAIAIVVRFVRSVVIGMREAKAKFYKDHGLCTICGYNLLATPDRCPECGSAHFAKAAEPS